YVASRPLVDLPTSQDVRRCLDLLIIEERPWSPTRNKLVLNRGRFDTTVCHALGPPGPAARGRPFRTEPQSTPPGPSEAFEYPTNVFVYLCLSTSRGPASSRCTE